MMQVHFLVLVSREKYASEMTEMDFLKTLRRPFFPARPLIFIFCSAIFRENGVNVMMMLYQSCFEKSEVPFLISRLCDGTKM